MSAKKQVRQESAEDHRKSLRKRLRKTIREQLFDHAVSEPISGPKSMQNRSKSVRFRPRSVDLGRTFWPPSWPSWVDLGSIRPRTGRPGSTQVAPRVDPGSIWCSQGAKLRLGVGAVIVPSCYGVCVPIRLFVGAVEPGTPRRIVSSTGLQAFSPAPHLPSSLS